MDGSLHIGVDGGGSKTECILADDSGVIVGRHLAPGCNPSVVGAEQARLIVTDALCALLAIAKAWRSNARISSALLCMAGSREFWRELSVTLADFGAVTVTDDSAPVLELATCGDPGLVLHGGTGSFVAARAPDGTLHYAGGLGWRFGDPGSGYDIGRRAISRALLELQGWASPSRLGPSVRDLAGSPADAKPAALTRWYYEDPESNRHIASFAPIALRLASEGDPIAQAIVGESIGELVTLATQVAAKLFPAIPFDTIPAGLSGPILTHPAVVTAITSKTPLPLVPLEDPPIEGVRRLLAKTG